MQNVEGASAVVVVGAVARVEPVEVADVVAGSVSELVLVAAARCIDKTPPTLGKALVKVDCAWTVMSGPKASDGSPARFGAAAKKLVSSPLKG